MKTSKKRSNGRTSDGKTDPDSPYGRFERLTKRLLQVPKKEINGPHRRKSAKKKVG